VPLTVTDCPGNVVAPHPLVPNPVEANETETPPVFTPTELVSDKPTNNPVLFCPPAANPDTPAPLFAASPVATPNAASNRSLNPSATAEFRTTTGAATKESPTRTAANTNAFTTTPPDA
jgi:hypothetical protein